MAIAILGVDLGKTSCSMVGVDERGTVVMRRSLRRQTLIDYVAKLPACVIGMEACCLLLRDTRCGSCRRSMFALM